MSAGRNFKSRSLLSSCEIFAYFAVYIVYIAVGLYKIYALRDRILSIAQFQFAEGWSAFHQRRRDDSNDEFENFSGFVAKYWPFYLLHALLSAALRWKRPHLQSYGNAAVCVLALFLTLDCTSLVIIAALVYSYYVVGQKNSKRLVWMVFTIWIVVINALKSSHLWFERVGYDEYAMVIVTLSWSLLRGCSYALTRIGETQSQSNIWQYLDYALYFPCLTYGPFISYKRFVARDSSINQTHGLKFLLALLRLAFWWLFMYISLHYFYIHYMARDVRTVDLMDSVFWRHAAGYFMGQFFFLYYVVTYGLGIAFAEQDGIPAPSRPRCIGRIHYYSDMWKYFDEGLYEFLFKHIYAELCTKNSSIWAKFAATAFTFGFVFVWHGCYKYVLIWSLLNFLCLAAEKCFKTLVSMPVYQSWTVRHLGVGASQRLHALLASQLFIPAAFSNVYFISGQEVGNFLMRGAYMSGMANYMALSFCSYCFFQCSELFLIDTRENKSKKTK